MTDIMQRLMDEIEPTTITVSDIEAMLAEIARLTEALRLQMEAKHKEAAEAKLWFQKAQEWKEALRAAESAPAKPSQEPSHD